jgi:hypothetical protein
MQKLSLVFLAVAFASPLALAAHQQQLLTSCSRSFRQISIVSSLCSTRLPERICHE